MNRRALLAGGLALTVGTGLTPMLLQAFDSPPRPYYADYSLAGLYNVAAQTTVPQTQHDAIGHMFERMRAGRYPDLFLHDGKLSTLADGNVTYARMERLFQSPTFITRKSLIFGALIDMLSAHPGDVASCVDELVVHPNVRSMRDGPEFNTGGLSLDAGRVLVEPGYPFVLTFLAHEAGHLARPPKDFGLLDSENFALQWEIDELEFFSHIEAAAKKLDASRRRLALGKYMMSLGHEFREEYPSPGLMEKIDVGSTLGTQLDALRASIQHQKEMRNSPTAEEPIPDVPSGDFVFHITLEP